MRFPLPVTNARVVMLNNYSAEWQSIYQRQNYLQLDPTVAHGLRSMMPLAWSGDIVASYPSFWEEAHAHGLKVGWSQSCFDAQGVGGLLTFARSHDALITQELAANSQKLAWLSHLAHESMSKMLAPKFLTEASVILSSKEIEILRWTADGKTSNEVSEIMCIVERTINYHLNNAMAKLGAANKTAATVKAAVLGLL